MLTCPNCGPGWAFDQSGVCAHVTQGGGTTRKREAGAAKLGWGPHERLGAPSYSHLRHGTYLKLAVQHP